MNRDGDIVDLPLETAQGLIRIFGSNAILQADLIAARMKKQKDVKGAILWAEVAEMVRKLIPG